MLTAVAQFRCLLVRSVLAGTPSLPPAQVQFDLRVLKFFKIGEHGKLDFVAEPFNVLNHTNVVSLYQFYGPVRSPLSVFATPNKASIPRQLQFSIDFEF
jgi:hypothetical protein